MKHQFATRKWKRMLSAGLSLAMAFSLLPSIPARAELSESAKTTPTPDKACSIPLPDDGSTATGSLPFPNGAAGSSVFRIPAMITMETGELLSIADIRYTQQTDGNGIDTMASISSDSGETWEYCFPFFFPDSYQDAHRQSTSFIDPGLLEGPDGTIYCIADVFPTEFSVQNVVSKYGSGYVDVNGTQRLALTDNYSNVSSAPTDDNDTKYLYYVDEFHDGYARILTREDNLPTDYAVDEWYNLYTVDEDGAYHADLKQKQVNVVNEDENEVQQNVYYRDSLFHVYQTGYLWVITSKDHGRTWEHPRDIIPQIKTEDDQTLLVSPGRGLTTSDGTLVIGLYRFNGSAASQRSSLMYSSDNGATWHRSDSIETGGWSSENEIVELEDGTLRMFYRGGGGSQISYADFTKNASGGYDVGECVNVSGCSVDSDCNISAISYSKKINGKQAILLSCPGGSQRRTNGKIFTLLVNEDKTLSCHHIFDVPGGEAHFAYSSLTELWDGSVALLWEDGPNSDMIQFDKFDIAELTASNASLENPDGTKSSAVSIHVAKGETSAKSYTAPEGTEIGPDFFTTPPNENVASAAAEKKTDLSVQMPIYSHRQNASSLADAFGTNAAPTETLELNDAEFTFTKNGDSYQIKNEATDQWLTIAPAATEYFASTAGDVVVTPQADGTVQINCTSTADKQQTGYAVFYINNNCNWNRTTANTDSNGIYNLTLWERSANAPEDSKIPGYQEVSIGTENVTSGKSYLITAKYNENIILLYPQNGVSNQPKLIAIKPSETSVKVYAHAGNNANLDAAFATATAQPQTIDLAKAEFSFAKNGDKYQIKNEATGQWLTLRSAADSYFETTAGDVTVTPQNDGTVQIFCTGTNNNASEIGYALFYTDQCNWNRANNTANSSYICNLTLWERSASAPEDSKIPGYQEASISADNLPDGKIYLITAKYNENIILLYPQNGVSNQPKLFVPKLSETAVKVYNHSTSNSDLDVAFATATAQPATIDLAKAEFTFTKNGDSYQIKNDATNQWMTIAPAATSYFASTAGDVVVTPQADGTVQINCTSTADKGQTGYAVFYINNNCNWNRTTANTDSNGIYNLTLWERSDSAPEGSKLPGYQEVSIGTENVTSGKSYLITAKYNENIILLYPQNGVSNQPKLIVGPVDSSGDDDEPSIEIPDPVVSQKIDIVVSITGINQGFTKAVIDGREYRIYVTDDTVSYPADEPIDVPYFDSYQANEEDANVAGVADAPDAKLALYDYVSAKANSASTFSKTANADLDIAEAEFTFTQDADNDGKWMIQSGNKYMVQNANRDLFSNEPMPMTVTQTEGADTFHIYNHAEAENGRYVMFVASSMNFNATSGTESNSNYKYELTLWKKDASATDSLLPGYKKAAAGEGIENNGVYLVSYVFQENEKEYAVLAYPKNENSIYNASALTKLARIDTMLRITPKKGGQFRVTIDGKECTYHFSDPNCKHEEDKHPVSGYIEADCETDGYTGDTVCGLCGQVITAGTAVPAKKHSWSSTSTQELTETQNGIILLTCGNSSMHQRKTLVYASAYKRLKEAFGNAPEEISDSNKALYKEEDVTALKNAYDAGAAVSKKAAAEQTNKEMYGSIDALAAASKQLHSHRDALEAELAWTLAKASPIHTAGKQEDHSQASWDAFSSAFTNASNPENSQKSYTDLLSTTNSLKTALSSLNQESAKGELTTLYNQYKDMEKGDYSDSTWNVFTKALEDAKTVLDKDNADTEEINHAKQALKKAVEELRTISDETIAVPDSIVYTSPEADQYPKAAVVSAGSSASSHTKQVSDWTEKTSTLTENNNVKTEIINKDGIWGFNGQLKSEHEKYDIAGENKAMAITFKLWLNKIESSQQVEILAKGQQYSLQLKDSALTLWMYNGSPNTYPTVTYTLNNSDHVGKWLDVMLIISGNSHQSIYVNGSCSEAIDNKPILSTASDPFTVGYRSGGDGIPFTSDFGYFADIKFYDCGTQDVSDERTRDYDAIVNLLNAKTPEAVISADVYDTKTIWSSVAEDQTETAMDPTAKFAANTVYKAATTFTAHDYFLFPDTEEFCTAVAETIETDRSNARINVSVADDKETMTVEVTYPVQTPLDAAKDAVRHALKTAESIYEKGQGSYSDETWNVFQEAYEAALNASEDADADTLNQLAEDLTNAQKALTRSAEKAKEFLDAVVAAADAIYQAGQENYTDESWNAFQTAYQAAQNAPADASAEDLQKLADDLDAAQKALVLDRNSVVEDAASSAATAEDKINNIGQGTYTTESWNAYTAAYNALKAELAKGDDADTAKLNELKKTLEKAESELTNDTDWINAKNALTKALNDASAIYAGGKKTYTDETWNAFVKAYQNADAKKNASISDSTAAVLVQLATTLNQTRTALKTVSSSGTTPEAVTSVDKGGVRYVITNAAKKTAMVEKGLNKKTLKKVVIPSTVTIDKVTYKVTEIKAKAFQNCTRITSVTIGANVTKIGNQSFSGCKKLKTLTFKGKKAPAFVSKPFKKTPSKMTVKLAKGMQSKAKKKMKSKLIKAGISKKAKIK